MNTEEKGYVLLDIEQLSELEKDIIIALGDDINNRPLPRRDSIKELKRTEELLGDKSKNRRMLYQVLSLLCLKDIIRLSNYHASEKKEPEYWLANDEKFSFIGFLKIIKYRLNKYSYLLKQRNIDSLTISKEVENEEIDKILKVVDKLQKNFNQNDDYDSLSENERKQFEDFFKIKKKNIKKLKKEQKENANHLIREELVESKNAIELAQLWLLVYSKRDDIKVILEKVVEYYFDKSKVLESKFINLTDFNFGINGLQAYNYILDIQLDEKIRRFERLEKDYDEIKNRLNKSLITNIEIITIFVAVITLIIGNVSFLPQISQTTTLGTTSFILLINGSLLTAISALVVLIAKIIVGKKKCKGLWIALLISLLLIGGGVFTSVKDNECTEKDEPEQDEPAIEYEISNDMTVEIQDISSNHSVTNQE